MRSSGGGSFGGAVDASCIDAFDVELAIEKGEPGVRESAGRLLQADSRSDESNEHSSRRLLIEKSRFTTYSEERFEGTPTAFRCSILPTLLLRRLAFEPLCADGLLVIGLTRARRDEFDDELETVFEMSACRG